MPFFIEMSEINDDLRLDLWNPHFTFIR